ncbi:MAG TPA: hypothetical protein VLF71_01500 [Candidatus Saccharimonadales bacterium]|nr:hypothetical protein [Candidatus Saccharimonadales bacterium]
MSEQISLSEAPRRAKVNRAVAIGAVGVVGAGAVLGFGLPALFGNTSPQVDIAPAQAPFVPNPNQESLAAVELAKGLDGSFVRPDPSQPTPRMGGDGPNQLLIFNGTVDIVAPDGATDYSINDPIVSSTERPASELGGGWVVTQNPHTDGTVSFTPLDLSGFNTVLHPVDSKNPYETVDAARGVPGQNGLAGVHVFEANADSSISQGAQLPGFEYNFHPMK